MVENDLKDQSYPKGYFKEIITKTKKAIEEHNRTSQQPNDKVTKSYEESKISAKESLHAKLKMGFFQLEKARLKLEEAKENLAIINDPTEFLVVYEQVLREGQISLGNKNELYSSKDQLNSSQGRLLMNAFHVRMKIEKEIKLAYDWRKELEKY